MTDSPRSSWYEPPDEDAPLWRLHIVGPGEPCAGPERDQTVTVSAPDEADAKAFAFEDLGILPQWRQYYDVDEIAHDPHCGCRECRIQAEIDREEYCDD